VRTLIRLSPLARFTGSPLYPLYLRALGARIGRGALILSRTVPVATDLITIGAGSVIRKNTSFTGYRAAGTVLQLGPVRLGADVLVGEQSVLDIGTAMGDGAQLGHSSSLQEGQTIPDGERWHGSPAEPGAVDYRVVPPAKVGSLRRVAYSTGQLVAALVPVVAVLVALVAVPKLVPEVADLADPAHEFLLRGEFYLAVLAVSFVLFFGGVLLSLPAMVTLPRLPWLFVRPDRVYRVLGIHYLAMTLVRRLTNSRFFMLVLGDSSFIVHFVRALGYDLSRVEQTGSNFGTEMQHDSPYLSAVGTGTMVSDGLSMMNADWSSTSFRVARAEIGERNFVGNNVVFPVGARTGANTLLATKVLVPLDGPVREDVGLLGSPPFEIPRNTRPDNPFRTMSEQDRRRRLTAKNRHNAAGILTVLVLQWIRVFVVLLVVAAGLDLYGAYRGASLVAVVVVVPVFSVLYSVLLELAVMGFRALRPQTCSIYDRYFWRHERLWKVYTRPIFTGTPFRGLLLRMAGVRIGRRVFDDGCVIPEKSLVTIGHDAVLNANSVIQCHSLEDGLFTSDRTVIGAGVTIGVGAFVHYGVTMGDGSALAADAYLMKGEEVPAGASWVGNPARSTRSAARETAPLSAAA
jgi:non-ribosomal peptide synthetase-like protein